MTRKIADASKSQLVKLIIEVINWIKVSVLSAVVD